MRTLVSRENALPHLRRVGRTALPILVHIVRAAEGKRALGAGVVLMALALPQALL